VGRHAGARLLKPPPGLVRLAARAGLLLVLATLLAGCAPRQLVLREVADALASQGQAAEDDLGLARDAAPFYLKLSESVLLADPGHLALAEAVAGGLTQYGHAFVAFEADRLAGQDARAAQRMRQRAARLFLRARRHAMAALQLHQPGIAAALSSAAPPPLQPGLVGVAYWAAAAWGSHIALSTDQPEVVADFPQAVRLATLAFAQQPGHGDGALAALMATLEAARPGGSPRQAEAWFQQAAAIAAGRQAGVLVAQAETMAQPAGDRPRFEALLRQAIAAADKHPSLANAVMRERAQWLLDSADDLF
jgi:predicted anti-sigma-YlaC factor YlaD